MTNHFLNQLFSSLHQAPNPARGGMLAKTAVRKIFISRWELPKKKRKKIAVPEPFKQKVIRGIIIISGFSDN